MGKNLGKVASMTDTSLEKIFYVHTIKYHIVTRGFASPATIALKIAEDGKSFKYGISVCNHMDNFCKKTGRKIAEYRLNNSFGVIPMPKALDLKTNREKCMRMLYTITESVMCNPRKWQNKLSLFSQVYDLPEIN